MAKRKIIVVESSCCDCCEYSGEEMDMKTAVFNTFDEFLQSEIKSLETNTQKFLSDDLVTVVTNHIEKLLVVPKFVEGLAEKGFVDVKSVKDTNERMKLTNQFAYSLYETFGTLKKTRNLDTIPNNVIYELAKKNASIYLVVKPESVLTEKQMIRIKAVKKSYIKQKKKVAEKKKARAEKKKEKELAKAKKLIADHQK